MLTETNQRGRNHEVPADRTAARRTAIKVQQTVHPTGYFFLRLSLKNENLVDDDDVAEDAERSWRTVKTMPDSQS